MKGILMKPDVWKGKQRALAELGMAVTRRLSGLKDINGCPSIWVQDDRTSEGCYYFHGVGVGISVRCKPRYQVGETVYIKEAWHIVGKSSTDNKYELQIQYKDGERIWREVSPLKWCWYTDNTGWGVDSRWRSPLFMPAWAARCFIKITDVRAERLQEITFGDMLNEGIELEGQLWNKVGNDFVRLWNSINKDYQWESNPWVFRYEFEKVEIQHG